MGQDRYTLMSNFFMNYKKSPHKESDLLEFYLSETARVNINILEKGIIRCKKTHPSFLPTLQQLLDCIKEEKPVGISVVEVDCFKCNGLGLTYSPFFFDSEKGYNLEVISMSQKIKEGDGVYFSQSIGRCSCGNGSKWIDRGLPVIEPHRYIRELAKENGWDCVFQSHMIAVSLNYKKRGLNIPKPNGVYVKLLDRIKVV